MNSLPLLLPLLILAIALVVHLASKSGRPKEGPELSNGVDGERLVASWLDRLDRGSYRVFHDLRLPGPGGRGRIQVDHVVVSGHGIFVVETRTCRGWISGCRYDREWSCEHEGKVRRLRNPLTRNEDHVKALAEWLDLPEMCFKNVVFFVGGARFKTEMPDHVVSAGHIEWLKSRQVTELMMSELECARGGLDGLYRERAAGPETSAAGLNDPGEARFAV